MERVELRAQNRAVTGKKVKQLRAESWIPAVVYGPDTPPQPIQIQEREVLQALRSAGSTALINLFVEDVASPNVVLARDVQLDAISGRLQHLDFYQVRLTEKVKTSPRLEIIGESPLVRSGGAVLVQILNQVEVECLPTDLVDSIPVDISGIERLDDSISIGDLPVPPGVTILADPGDAVVSVVPPRAALVEEVEEEAIFEEGAVEDAADETAAEEDAPAEA